MLPRIISLYPKGLIILYIQSYFKETYGFDVSSGFISHVTNMGIDEVKRWYQRSLDVLYSIVYLDYIVIKSYDGWVCKCSTGRVSTFVMNFI